MLLDELRIVLDEDIIVAEIDEAGSHIGQGLDLCQVARDVPGVSADSVCGGINLGAHPSHLLDVCVDGGGVGLDVL